MPMNPETGSPLWGSPKTVRRRVGLWRIVAGVLLWPAVAAAAYALARIVT